MMKKFNKLYTLIMEQNTNDLYNAFLSIIPQFKKIDVDDFIDCGCGNKVYKLDNNKCLKILLFN